MGFPCPFPKKQGKEGQRTFLNICHKIGLLALIAKGKDPEIPRKGGGLHKQRISGEEVKTSLITTKEGKSATNLQN